MNDEVEGNDRTGALAEEMSLITEKGRTGTLVNQRTLTTIRGEDNLTETD